jgi:hypothetical protein
LINRERKRKRRKGDELTKDINKQTGLIRKKETPKAPLSLLLEGMTVADAKLRVAFLENEDQHQIYSLIQCYST